MVRRRDDGPVLLLTLCCAPGTGNNPDGGAPDSGHGDSGPSDDTAWGDPCPDLGADHECCRDIVDYLWACEEDFPPQTTLTGRFTTSEPYFDGLRWTLVDEAGSSYAVTFFGGEALARLPDLAALGTVSVVDSGGCETDGEGGQGGIFTLVDEAGALVLAIGASPGTSGGVVTASIDPDDETCPPRPGDTCFDWTRNLPATLVVQGASAELFQGETAELDAYDVYVFMASAGVAGPNCDDVGGQWENWAVFPVAAP